MADHDKSDVSKLVRVVDLPWVRNSVRGVITHHHIAHSPIGTYECGVDIASIPYWLFGDQSFDAAGIAEAKAAAQADFERRILACITARTETAP